MFVRGCVVVAVTAVSALSWAAETSKCEKLAGEPASKLARFQKIFGSSKPVMAMVHLAGFTDEEVLERARKELEIFERHGVNAVIVENYHGTIRQMATVLEQLAPRFPKIVFGINVLPNELEVAYAMAVQLGAKFIQFDHVAGRYGGGRRPVKMESGRFRELREAYPEIAILGGVHPKYYFPAPGSNLKDDLAKGARRSTAVVVTGQGTGIPTSIDKVRTFREILGPDEPLVIGAGVDIDNVREQLTIGDGLIIGSYFKGGDTFSDTRERRVEMFMKVVREIRGENP